jgi:hypothetical protein
MGEGGVVQPVVVFDNNAMHFRQKRRRATEGDSRKQCEFKEEFDDDHLRPSRQ